MLQGPIQKPRAPRWDDSRIPSLLRPILRAYLLGYASSVGSRLLSLLFRQLDIRSMRIGVTKPPSHVFTELFRVLRVGFDPRRFPTFCAALVGGSSLLQIPLTRAINASLPGLSDTLRERLSRLLAAFVAAWLSLRLLQLNQSQRFLDVAVAKPEVNSASQTRLVRSAGHTLDLTLFAATRATDVIVGELWARRRRRRAATGNWTLGDELVSRSTDSAVFAISCAVIMWTWFYSPSGLPRAYNRWIGAAAAVDARLIEALRRCRSGKLRYGEDNGQASLLQDMCIEYKWPLQWGDPSTSVPFPCEMVHMGRGPSCELHALSRFCRSWWWSMATYLPISLLMVAGKPTRRSLSGAFVSASRSSAFLGAFITLFYYGVCLARTRLGPLVVGRDAVACQRIDGGISVGTGCFLCGWSILAERAGRRKDVALFVAPRALATLFPRRYNMSKQWGETLVFATSTAVVFTCAYENKARVRGMLGRVLGFVLET